MATVAKKLATETSAMKKTPVVTEPVKQQDDYVTLDFRGLTLPWAILLSVLIFTLGIGSAVYFGIRSIPAAPTTTGTVTPTSAAADYSAASFEQADVSVSDNPGFGDKSTAKIVIVELSDFVCPFCESFHSASFPDIKKNYIDTGKAALVYRYYPLSIHEPAASMAAKAAICVNSLYGADKWRAYHEAFFTGVNGMVQNAYDAQNSPIVNMKTSPFYALFPSIGVDTNKIKNCMALSSTTTKLAEDQKAFEDLSTAHQAAGLGTPTFVIGIMDKNGNVHGRLIVGAQPYVAFQNVIEEQLALAK